MTYKQFERKLLTDFNLQLYETDNVSSLRYFYDGVGKTPNGYYLVHRYSTGGMDGGSCWDDSEPETYYDNSPHDWIVLDEILEKLSPDISFLKYRKLKTHILESKYTQWEYYGNCTYYTIEAISFKDLYDFICEK